MNRRFQLPLFLGLLALCLICILASLLVGTETLSIAQAWAEWRSGAPRYETPTLNILLNQRLPRTLAALIAGAGLSLAGCAFQALLRNPLATPYTLGVASAGAFGAWAATVIGQGTGAMASILGFSFVQIAAFACASADVLVIFLLAARKRMSPSILLLTGVTLGMLANAGIMTMRYFARPDRLVMMDRWLMGGVDVLGYQPVITLYVGVTPCLFILLAQASQLDQLGFSREMAVGRGVKIRRLQAVTFLVGSAMIAVIVSKVGPIGFVGLIVPHAIRGLTGSRHRVLMPLSAVAGGGFLCFCDIIARKLFPGETPLGIVTSLLGAPFFLYLLTRRRFTGWEG